MKLFQVTIPAILIAVLVSLFAVPAARNGAAVSADASFVDGFENGDVLAGGWDDAIVTDGSSITLSSAYPFEGSQSALFTLNVGREAWLAHDLPLTTKQLTTSFQFRLDNTLRRSDAPIYLAGFWNEAGQQIAWFYYRTDTGWFQADYRDESGAMVYGIGTASHVLQPDIWYNIEIAIALGSSARLTLIVDDRSIFSKPVTLSATGLSRLGLGQVDGDVAASGTFAIDLVRFGTGSVEGLDRGRVSLGFDDGGPTCWTVARPLLDEFGFKASFYIVTDYVIPTRSWAISLEQIGDLAAAGHEIQSHTVDHYRMPTLTDDGVEFQIANSKADLSNWGYRPVSLAYPYGAFDDRVLYATREHYQLGLRTGNALNGRSALEGRMQIWRVDAAAISIEEAKELVDEALARDKWLVFYFHNIGDDHPGNGNWVTTDYFRALLIHLRERRADVVPIERAIDWPRTNAVPTAALQPLPANSGGDLTLTATFSDVDGHGNLSSARILMGSSTSTAGAIALRYDCAARELVLADDTGIYPAVGAVPGTAAILENSQVRIDLSHATLVASGNDLTLTLPLEFGITFKGTKKIYLESVDVVGASSGLGHKASFNVKPFSAPSAIVNFSLTPILGKSAVFTLTAQDSDGVKDFDSLCILVEGSDGRTVEFEYRHSKKRLLLRADDGIRWIGRNFGSLSRMKNSLVTIYPFLVKARPTADTLELIVPMEFQTAFKGKKKVYARVTDISGNDTGWQEMGQISISSNRR